MKISLRKASAVQVALSEFINSVDIDLGVQLNEFSEAMAEVQRYRDKLIGNDALRDEATRAVFLIRQRVGHANLSSGISDLLAEMAYIDKRMSQLRELAGASVVPSEEEIIGRLEKIRSAPAAREMFSRDVVTVGVLTENQVDLYKKAVASLKKQKQRVSDLILDKNVTTEIQLPPEVVTTLTKLDIL